MKKDSNRTINLQKDLSFDEIKTEELKSLSVKTNFEKSKGEKEKLTRDEKYILRLIFQNKIYKADGQQFEDIFSDIMKYAYPDFQQIRPYGRAGDMKNDGYIKSKGIYFQVYGPEDIAKSVSYAKRKLREDFSGLLQEWKHVNEFYFVINDKYKGIPPDLEIEVNKLITENNLKGGVKGAADLQNLLFSLADDQIVTITGHIPDPSKIRTLDYSVLNEVIAYIMQMPSGVAIPADIKFPDWDKKIKFNGLSQSVAVLLNNGSIYMANLTEYLNNQGNFLGDALRDKMSEIYISEKERSTDKEHSTGDEIFLRILTRTSPREEYMYRSAVIVIMAKYFEACDILERPPEDYQ
jgi:hypothetical protein